MAIKTDAQLLVEVAVIKNETTIGANTKTRVGVAIENIVDSKINKDKLSDNSYASNAAAVAVLGVGVLYKSTTSVMGSPIILITV